MNAADYDPEFVARSPQLTAERLRHAESMRQHWYAMCRQAVAEVVRLKREMAEQKAKDVTA